MTGYIEKTSGATWLDLYDHFCMRRYVVGGKEYRFYPIAANLGSSFCEIEPLGGLGIDDFRITLGFEDYQFGLAFGWPDATFHQQYTWGVDGWRQQETHELSDTFGAWYGTYTSRQFTTVDEIGRDVEKELKQLLAKWERYQRTGQYAILPEEVAALLKGLKDRLVHESGRGNLEKTRQLHGAEADLAYRYAGIDQWAFYPGPGRSSVRLDLSGPWDKKPYQVAATRSTRGWRFDLFAPYSRRGECAWYECVVFACDYDPKLPKMRCPLPHSTPHEMRATVIQPWHLIGYLLDWLPAILAEAHPYTHPSEPCLFR